MLTLPRLRQQNDTQRGVYTQNYQTLHVTANMAYMTGGFGWRMQAIFAVT